MPQTRTEVHHRVALKDVCGQVIRQSIALHVVSPHVFFLGQTESPLLVQPYLEDMSDSEIFVVMCSGLASVAGSVMGAFIAMGVSPGQLKHKYANGIYSLDYGYI